VPRTRARISLAGGKRPGTFVRKMNKLSPAAFFQIL
jgi:hypothetical protein